MKRGRMKNSDHTPASRSRRFLSALACIAALAACGGGGGGAGIARGPTVTPGPPVDGPAWWGFGRDAQHSALGAVATQDLNRIA